MPLADVLEAASGDADILWVPWEFLEKQGVQPWSDLPAWVPAPVADLAAWDRDRPQEPLRAGMTREREAELLRTFRAEGRPPGP